MGNLTIAQQQMVEIVKAVSFNGNIIVMDEPTSSLSNQGRFSGAVFPKQGMYFPLLQIKIYPAQGINPGKALFNPYHFQNRLFHKNLLTTRVGPAANSPRIASQFLLVFHHAVALFPFLFVELPQRPTPQKLQSNFCWLSTTLWLFFFFYKILKNSFCTSYLSANSVHFFGWA